MNLKRCVFLPLMATTLFGCAQHQSDDSVNIMTINIAPELVDCVGVAPMKCTVVDGNYFYDQIDGFEFEPGYEYTLQIKRIQRFTPENAPADASLYRYELIEVLEKR
ncbi:DUF4377 domain-containing protein [Vibrio campbellii]|uniref:DUF4377 domain-containing protein n=1 Tax=Vibrio campbellii TaxID=680 RepID=A0ABY5IJK3_9VIBR|nr:DUF4377 domain-containing protein [Vibrio campbellii]UTZ24070.1 DUF4377 domain-containing protein [Vibrio campbellii]UTZ33797.1 DUF4377 domain-containing protein [Vibrio campbellii]